MIIQAMRIIAMKTPLERLFDRHYADGPSTLRRFRKHLAEVQLDFEVETSLNEFESKPQEGFPRGIPSFIHYYIYGTRFGTGKKPPADSSDGIGLNMGCPIRLARAMDVLFSLKPEDRKELLGQIRARKNHFACVEELLWLTLWKQRTDVSRGGELVPQANGNKIGDIDWFFISDGTPIYLEAKFRPTDWIRNPGCGGGPVDEGLFDEIGHKFPTERSAFRKCVAAITGYAEPIAGFDDADNSFFALCEKKLLTTPGVDAILYRSLLGQIYVCSLEKAVVAQIAGLIRFPQDHEYPLSYPVVFNREFTRQRAKKPTRLPEQGRLIFAIVPDNRPTPLFRPQYPYRYNIPRRGSKGEPQYQNVPPFLNSSAVTQSSDY